jgi:hypothetical protein
MSSGQLLRVLELCSSVQQKTMNKNGLFVQNHNSPVQQENLLANLATKLFLHTILCSNESYSSFWHVMFCPETCALEMLGTYLIMMHAKEMFSFQGETLLRKQGLS